MDATQTLIAVGKRGAVGDDALGALLEHPSERTIRSGSALVRDGTLVATAIGRFGTEVAPGCFRRTVRIDETVVAASVLAVPCSAVGIGLARYTVSVHTRGPGRVPVLSGQAVDVCRARRPTSNPTSIRRIGFARAAASGEAEPCDGEEEKRAAHAGT